MKEVTEKTIFEKSVKGRVAVEPVELDVPQVDAAKVMPKNFLRDDIKDFPEVSAIDVVRHYEHLSQKNFGIDSGFYPLGSCTMKYNPRINETLSRLSGFNNIHPYDDEKNVQGALQLIYELEKDLTEISGMDGITLQPSAGAQGELCGMLMIAKYFKAKGEKRTKVIVPDTAHGTNPASSALSGFEIIKLSTEGCGTVKPEQVEKVMTEDVAAIMLTNPNTLGIFEKNIKEIAKVVHAKGGFLYCDGANMNAIMGQMKLGDMGVDLIQYNLHKTFSTPHGGGGPGSGPLAAKKELLPFMPIPRVEKNEEGLYHLNYDLENSIGRLRTFYGNFLVLVKAYCYIKRLGAKGLRNVSETAILNGNYIKEKLKDTYHLPFDEICMHECILTDKKHRQYGITTMDIAKRLIDYDIHPPTVYFPLVVDGAMMVEPTETENLETMDRFIEVMKDISREARETPEKLTDAPSFSPIGRVDEVRAARHPRLKWTQETTDKDKTTQKKLL